MEHEEMHVCLARHGERIDQLLLWRAEMERTMREIRGWVMGIAGGVIVSLIMLAVGLLRGVRI